MKLVFSYLILVFFLASCASPRYYTPNVIVTPCFRKAGDCYFNANTNVFNKGSGTLGCALTNNFGIYANFSGSSESNDDPIFPPVIKFTSTAYYGGLGFGYYKFRQKNKFCGKGFELFTELSYGQFNISSHADPSYTSHPYKTVFHDLDGIMNRGAVVANFSKTYDRMQWVNSLRYSVLTFYGYTADDYFEGEAERLNYQKFYQTIEYGSTLLIGRRQLKFMLQHNLYYCLNSDESNGALQRLNFSGNFGFVISPKWK